jgi:hypothetical protein
VAVARGGSTGLIKELKGNLDIIGTPAMAQFEALRRKSALAEHTVKAAVLRNSSSLARGNGISGKVSRGQVSDRSSTGNGHGHGNGNGSSGSGNSSSGKSGVNSGVNSGSVIGGGGSGSGSVGAIPATAIGGPAADRVRRPSASVAALLPQLLADAPTSADEVESEDEWVVDDYKAAMTVRTIALQRGEPPAHTLLCSCTVTCVTAVLAFSRAIAELKREKGIRRSNIHLGSHGFAVSLCRGSCAHCSSGGCSFLCTAADMGGSHDRIPSVHIGSHRRAAHVYALRKRVV